VKGIAPPALDALVREALATGRIAGLPDALLIDGRHVPAHSGERMETIDPGTGRAFAAFAAGGADDVDAAVRAARRALDGAWRRTAPADRGRILNRAAALIRAQAARLAVAETLDVGKPLAEARGDVASAARAFEYYAGACDKLHGDTLPQDDAHVAWTIVEPAGVAAQIVPWNYPLSTAARGIAPALAAGCTLVVKPAEQTPLTALMLGDLLVEAGLPPGVCNVVTGTGTVAGAALAAHPGIDHLTFTGSVATGQRVMRAAADNVTRLLLELGGKSPAVVCADADVGAAAASIAAGIFENAGQICSAASRVVVARTVHDELVAALAAHAKSLTLGHGLRDPGMGPVNSAAQLARVEAAVDGALARGVRAAAGGHPYAGAELDGGFFYAPTILDDVPADDAAIQQEIFGPVLAVQVFDDEDEALALANGTPYALCAGVFTRDFAAAHRFARALDAGQVYVNEWFAGGIEVPFGGNRRSGFGREKGLEALRSYSRVKGVAARL
jgi:acyl-CoA reductase-like NAD-dependent aldehyde dehydrogenase